MSDTTNNDFEGLGDVDPLADLDEAEEIMADLGEDSLIGDVESASMLRERARAWSDARAFKALSEVACAITANLDFHSLTKQILDVALDSVGAERGIVFLGGAGDDDLVPVVARSIDGKDIKDIERVSRTILRSGQLGNTIYSGDAVRDARFEDIPSVQLKQIRTVVCMPMVARDELLGVIYVDSPSRPNAFSHHTIEFMRAFAGLAAVAVQNATLHGELRRENVRLRRRLDAVETFGRIVTVNKRMVSVVRKATMVGQVDAPVMLLGESGTGKELVARTIHEAGPRSLNPFVAYNCAAVPSDLMESIFFGHVKGSFTGANRDAPGVFRLADRGVLFLDEIADLSAPLQAKLLRVLENGRVRPVGSETEVEVDVRLITATSRDLEEAVGSGQFREDLFYRINVLEIRIPALRDRPDDVPVLVEHFIKKHTDGTGRRAIRLTPGCMEFLQTLPWRGNVRELENLVRRMLVLSDREEIDVGEAKKLLPRISMTTGAPHEEVAPAYEARTSPAPRPPRAAPMSLEDQEREAIIRALEKAGGNKSKAARLLGVHRNSLLRRMARLEIEWAEE